MGTLHAISGDFKESINWFDKAISTFPYFVEAHFNKAVSYQKLFDVGNAIRAYRKVLELGDPSDTPAKQARSFLDGMAASIRKSDGIDLDSYIESQSEFDRAFEIDPQYLPAATNRVVAESMEEGIPLNVAGFKRVEFGKERFFASSGA